MLDMVPKDRRKIVNLLNPGQKRDIEGKIESLERFLKEHKNSSFKRIREADEGFARQELKRYRAMLAARTAPAVSGTDRDKVVRRVKYLETKIRDGMPTKDEMMGKRHSNPGQPNSKYQEAIPSVVDQHMKWEAKNAGNIREWKHLKRILEPDNPDATNVEQLRKIH